MFEVLDVYEITWYSNRRIRADVEQTVLDVYEITWYSNFML